MSAEEIWQKFLPKIESKVSRITYISIFKELKIYSYKDNKIIIIVPNNELLIQNINKNYSSIVEEIMNDITNDTCTIEYVLSKDIDKIEEKKKEITKKVDKIEEITENVKNYQYSSDFNPKYTFETFVIGESNKLAYGTALAVAQNPGKLYNPYFIYAKSGLGKTHLMHAIGNYIVTHSDKRVLYISAEKFKDEFRAISSNKSKNDDNMVYLEAFRDKYRNVDVLMIDDIQFLETAGKTQIEFTNTFNTLYDNEKQIIIASDTSINDYKYLEDRLKTRFRWGLTESIYPPEFELKKNIIKNKIMINGFDLSLNDEVISYIAKNCGNDVRNLENAVLRLVAYKSMMSNVDEISLEIAQNALKEYIEVPVYKNNSIANIINVVAKYYGIEPSMIKGKMKKKNIADARQITMYLCRMLTDESLERIGLEIGGRDHSTVIYSYEKISNELKTNQELNEVIRILKEKISV